jgi:hypothetical protein
MQNNSKKMVEFGDTNVKNTLLESNWFAISKGQSATGIF